MFTSGRTVLLSAALVACGLLAGFFYAFAAGVNQGLGDLDDAAYIAAMQSINLSIPNGVFVLAFVGAPLLMVAATLAHAAAGSPRTGPLVAATALVIVGGLLLTFFVNVPLNDELATVDVGAVPAVLADARADYEGPWNAWNAVRAVLCTAGLACVGWAMRLPAARTSDARERPGALRLRATA